jgi:hypothetical protein
MHDAPSGKDHASKCPLRGQSLPQRDKLHLGRRSGGRVESVQDLGHQWPSGFVRLCQTLEFKKVPAYGHHTYNHHANHEYNT